MKHILVAKHPLSHGNRSYGRHMQFEATSSAEAERLIEAGLAERVTAETEAADAPSVAKAAPAAKAAHK